MNIVKSTANKVMELEKRLDNELKQENLKVSEVKHYFPTTEYIEEENIYEVTSFTGGSEATDAVLQGEVRIRVFSACNIRLSVFLDGYEIYNRIQTYESGVFSLNVLKTIKIAKDVEQKLVIKLERSGGGSAEIASYNFFVWGYGEAITFGEVTEEPRISGAGKEGEYTLYLVLNEELYSYTVDAFPENLSSADFTFKGLVKAIAPVYFETTTLTEEGVEETVSTLLNYVVTPDGKLVMKEGSIENLTTDGLTVIDEGVTNVSVTIENTSSDVVVVYSKENEIYSFSYDGTTRGESLLIYEFKERVEDVALIKNCETTTFLAVSLESGKNYLFSSVTEVSASVKESRLSVALNVAFS